MFALGEEQRAHVLCKSLLSWSFSTGAPSTEMVPGLNVHFLFLLCSSLAYDALLVFPLKILRRHWQKVVIVSVPLLLLFVLLIIIFMAGS